MKLRLCVRGALVGAMWSLSSLVAQETPLLRPNDVVGIFGDSAADGSFGQMLGVYFAACQPKRDLKEISGLGFEKSFTGFGGSGWVHPGITIYDGPTQKEGVVTIEVEPAAKGETKVDLEGVISVRREK